MADFSLKSLMSIAGSRSQVSVSGSCTTLHTTREIEYRVLHPDQPVFDSTEVTMRDLVGSRPVLIVSDHTVAAIYGPAWRTYARAHLDLAGEVLLEPGEVAKSWDHIEQICDAAVRAGLPRNGIVIGIGGGIVLDTAGFAASVFRRGVGYVRVPTTLVGLVDVAVGIKQGVNAHGRKNLLGAFYTPIASVNDYRFLETLDGDNISCGFAEILKMALLRDTTLLALLETHGAELLATRFAAPVRIAREVARRAELLMMQELAPNLFEEDLARLVDFGHSFSPAMEIATCFQIPHGHAVALDMLLCTALSKPDLLPRLKSLYRVLGLPTWDSRIPNADVLSDALADIRKHRAGSLNLVVLRRPGEPYFLQAVSRSNISRALDLLREEVPDLCSVPQAAGAASNRNNYDRLAL